MRFRQYFFLAALIVGGIHEGIALRQNKPASSFSAPVFQTTPIQTAVHASTSAAASAAPDRIQRLRAYFPPKNTGDALATAAAYLAERDFPGTPENEIYESKMAELLKSPEQTLSTIRYALDRLPSEFSEERQLFIQLGAALDLRPQDLESFLMDEAKRPALKARGLATAQDTAVAVEVLLRLGFEPRIAEILDAHAQDPNAQRAVVFAFAMIDSERAEAFRKEYGL